MAAVFALLCGLLLFNDPGRAPTLTIDNPTPYDIRVEVSDTNRAEWTVLGLARQQCAASIESPIDRGGRWVFRLRTQGLVSQEIAVERADLERANWHFEVPTAMAQQWEANGIPHPPRQSC
jgi:hypothetical protein